MPRVYSLLAGGEVEYPDVPSDDGSKAVVQSLESECLRLRAEVRTLTRERDTAEQALLAESETKKRYERTIDGANSRISELATAQGISAQQYLEKCSEVAMMQAVCSQQNEEIMRLHDAISRPVSVPPAVDLSPILLAIQGIKMPEGRPMPAFELSFDRDQRGKIASPVLARPRV